jgi:hypothetical protein
MLDVPSMEGLGCILGEPDLLLSLLKLIEACVTRRGSTLSIR